MKPGAFWLSPPGRVAPALKNLINRGLGSYRSGNFGRRRDGFLISANTGTGAGRSRAEPSGASRGGRPAHPSRPEGGGRTTEEGRPPAKARPAAEHEILFQSYFKSVGPRTYAAQVKRAGNGNHFLVLTEGQRDEKTGDVRKSRVFVFSEDFVALFKMLKDAAEFIKAHPVPDEVRAKREKFWAGRSTDAARGLDAVRKEQRPDDDDRPTEREAKGHARWPAGNRGTPPAVRNGARPTGRAATSAARPSR